VSGDHVSGDQVSGDHVSGDHDQPGEPDAVEVTRSEEELHVTTRARVAGEVRARKVADSYHVEELIPCDVEHAELERAPAEPTDSGQVETLPDGSISIPLFEEQIIVEKRLVVRERIILRKYRTTEARQVEADLRRERLEVDASPSVSDQITP
jgi:uncharacterized protein (TIGR02271 family)